ncbi:EamA family transporter [Lichenicoccus sp.]|uniref:EamA family transporter n=1 Tax=Lichenicoccus sp. TaxID=2781899 RepID=UPI003D0F3964
MRSAGAPAVLAAPALLAAIVSFQIGAALAKSLFTALGPFGVAGLRIGLAAVLLAAIWRPWRRLSGAASGGVAKQGAIIAYGLSLGAMNLCFYLALARLPLGIAVAIEFTGPLALAVFGSRRRLDLLWAALAALGLALLLAPRTSLRGLDPIGIAFGFLAGLGWALYVLAGQRIDRELPGGQATALGMAVAAVVIVPFCLPAMVPVLHRPVLLAAALLVAVLSSALPYALELFALRRMTARGYGVLSSVDPALAALSGLALLGEQLSAWHWLAIGCIVLASVGSTLAADAPKIIPA